MNRFYVWLFTVLLAGLSAVAVAQTSGPIATQVIPVPMPHPLALSLDRVRDRVYVAENDGIVAALDAAHGNAILWATYVDVPLVNLALDTVNKRLYVGYLWGPIAYVLNTEDGSQIGRFDLADGPDYDVSVNPTDQSAFAVSGSLIQRLDWSKVQYRQATLSPADPLQTVSLWGIDDDWRNILSIATNSNDPRRVYAADFDFGGVIVAVQ